LIVQVYYPHFFDLQETGAVYSFGKKMILIDEVENQETAYLTLKEHYLCIESF
jgi:hypothetical protein